MARSTWEELPESVRAAIQRQTGPMYSVSIPSAGRNSDFAATLYTERGPVFCKGIAAEGKRGRMHRHEADINPWLPSAVAPSLRWRTEADGWLLLGFDHAPGEHANLSPGSPDLALITDSLTVMGRGLAGCGADAPRLAPQWARFLPWRRLAKDTPADLDEWARDHLDQLTAWEDHAVEAVEGDDLVHTDLHPLNILVGEGRARVIDWAWSRLGAAAVDPAFLIIRLITAGHSPSSAEQWAESIPVWRGTPLATRTALAVEIWGMWEQIGRDNPLPHTGSLVAAARQWALYLMSGQKVDTGRAPVGSGNAALPSPM